jgi:pyridoxal phosphate-dependent aminotransferase EpsN
MNLQPVFAGCEVVGGGVAEALFRDGLCLPSGTALAAAVGCGAATASLFFVRR